MWSKGDELKESSDEGKATGNKIEGVYLVRKVESLVGEVFAVPRGEGGVLDLVPRLGDLERGERQVLTRQSRKSMRARRRPSRSARRKRRRQRRRQRRRRRRRRGRRRQRQWKRRRGRLNLNLLYIHESA